MRKLRVDRFITILALLLSFSLCASAQAQKKAAKHVVTFDSFGPVKVGMTVEKASKALGVRLESTEQGTCRYFEANGRFRDMGFMVNDGTIARFDISVRGFATDKGAQVGDSEARIKQLYKGKYKVSKHRYSGGSNFAVETKGGEHAVIIETDGKRVIYIRAGRFPEVGYDAGCQ